MVLPLLSLLLLLLLLMLQVLLVVAPDSWRLQMKSTQ